MNHEVVIPKRPKLIATKRINLTKKKKCHSDSTGSSCLTNAFMNIKRNVPNTSTSHENCHGLLSSEPKTTKTTKKNTNKNKQTKKSIPVKRFLTLANCYRTEAAIGLLILAGAMPFPQSKLMIVGRDDNERKEFHSCLEKSLEAIDFRVTKLIRTSWATKKRRGWSCLPFYKALTALSEQRERILEQIPLAHIGLTAQCKPVLTVPLDYEVDEHTGILKDYDEEHTGILQDAINVNHSRNYRHK